MRTCFTFALACAMVGIRHNTRPRTGRPSSQWLLDRLRAGRRFGRCRVRLLRRRPREQLGRVPPIGGTPSDRILVGGEINGWAKTDDQGTYDAEVTIGSIFGTLLFYPSAGNFYLQGGLGFTGMVFEVENDSGESGKLETSGFAVLMGLGYDIRVARGFSLTPYVSYAHSFSSDVEVSAGGVSLGLSEDLNPNVFQFGLVFTWHQPERWSGCKRGGTADRDDHCAPVGELVLAEAGGFFTLQDAVGRRARGTDVVRPSPNP